MKKTNIGGQAIIEGVMMRGKNVYAMAVRNPEGEIVVETDEWSSIAKSKIFKLPILRGMVAFLDSMISGTKILMRSAEIAGEEWVDEEPSKFEKYIMDKLGDKVTDIVIYISVCLSMLLGLCLFYMLPLFLGSFFNEIVPIRMLGVVEGLIRFAIFFCYLLLISRMKDIQRVFQYHGAEHKTIACYESGLPLTVENVRPCTRLHKRCGTSFLLFIMVLSMVIFFFVNTDVWWLRLLTRIALVPVIAGLSYEIVRWAGSSESKFVAIVSYPGICLQKLTTAEPDDKQIETAIKAMQAVIDIEGESTENEDNK